MENGELRSCHQLENALGCCDLWTTQLTCGRAEAAVQLRGPAQLNRRRILAVSDGSIQAKEHFATHAEYMHDTSTIHWRHDALPGGGPCAKHKARGCHKITEASPSKPVFAR